MSQSRIGHDIFLNSKNIKRKKNPIDSVIRDEYYPQNIHHRILVHPILCTPFHGQMLPFSSSYVSFSSSYLF